MKAQFEWYDASCEPINIDLPILAWTNNDKLVVFKDTKTWLNGDTKHPFSGFKRLVEKYNIKFWVYQNEVLKNNDNI